MRFRPPRAASLRQISVYAFVGAAATLTHYVIALLFARVMHPLFSNGVGYLFGLAVSYNGHHRLTFQVHSSEANHRSRFPRFVLVSASAVALSELILWYGLERAALPLWQAQAAAIAVVPPLTYLLGRYWVFRQSHHHPLLRTVRQKLGMKP